MSCGFGLMNCRCHKNKIKCNGEARMFTPAKALPRSLILGNTYSLNPPEAGDWSRMRLADIV